VVESLVEEYDSESRLTKGMFQTHFHRDFCLLTRHFRFILSIGKVFNMGREVE
jgi:hypothetical protein